MNCIFCKIINKEIPGEIIYEDDDVVAFLDLSQITKGHTLVLPKKHYANVLEIAENDYLKVMKITQKLAKAIVKTYNASGCNILTNCGEVAGQSVNHFHVHITPRYNKGELTFNHSDNTGKYNLTQIKNDIIKNL